MSRLKKFGHLLLSTFVLLAWGLKNRFPLVYPDTGDHIASGFENYIPYSRPIFYGLFLRHSSLHETLWISAFLQALMLSVCIYFVVKYLAKGSWKIFYLIIGICCLASSISVTASMLIPDVFSPILLLSAVLFLAFDMTLRDKLLCLFFVLISLPMHSSHLLIVGALLLVYVVFNFPKRFALKIDWRRIGILVGVCVSSVVLAIGINYSISGKWKYSNGSSVFLINRFNDLNILKPFLKEACHENEYPICEYADRIDGNFLWGDNSPLYEVGGWTAVEDEYKTVVVDLLISPKYLKRFIVKSLEAGLMQCWMFEIDYILPLTKGSAPHWAITSFYPHYLSTYDMAQQNQSNLDFTGLNERQRTAMLISFLVLIVFFIYGKRDNELKNFIALLLIAYVANAFVCGSLSLPLARYQSRISFFLPMISILILYRNKDLLLSWLRAQIQSEKSPS